MDNNKLTSQVSCKQIVDVMWHLHATEFLYMDFTVQNELNNKHM